MAKQDLKNTLVQAKEKLGEEAANIIAKDLNIKQWDTHKKTGVCPFHNKNGEPENTPSFIWNEKDNAFKCFGCGKRYGIVDHYQDHYNLSTYQALTKLFDETNIDYDLYESKNKSQNPPEPELNQSMDKVYEYLGKRKISKEILDKYDVKQTAKGEIVFEHYNQYDQLLLVTYRPSHKIKPGEHKNRVQNKDSKGNPVPMRNPLWNMNHVVFHKPLIITEGVIDCLSVIESGYSNAVSVPMGAGNHQWIEENWEWLDNFDSFIICCDNDEAGEKMKKAIMPRLGDWRCKTIEYPERPDGTQCNDLNEVLYRYNEATLNEMVINATDVPIQNIVDMADIEDIDLSTAEGIKSGLKCLDKMIAKFYMGTLAVHTGINGSGKSSFLNQICVVEPTNQGYKSFVFSGELTNPQLRNWIEYPMAGINHIKSIKVADDQPTFYRVHDDAKAIMREWYRGKIFFYDNEIDKSAASILDRMTVLARKYGVKNFLIDNLMTVDISQYQGSSVWEKQKEFVLDLLRFAITYQVVVHLVAHPRKTDFVKRLSKMDVSGTGDITNLAHYVTAMHRVTNKEKQGIEKNNGDWEIEPIHCDAILDLFKNRPIGYQDVAFKLDFDERTKRFYQDDYEHYKQYRWDKREINLPRIIEEDIAWLQRKSEMRKGINDE